MSVITGLSGNEIYCMAEKGFQPGNIVIGNSVYSLGVLGGIGSNLKSALGGELKQLTSLIEEGRRTALKRMVAEAQENGATGVTGVNSQLLFHDGNIEFLAIGSCIHSDNKNNQHKFTTSDDGQELYAQLDVGYQPHSFAFGNVVYSLGIARGLMGSLRTLGRGEVAEYSNMFNKTRHLALTRIIEHAKSNKANAVLGIKTTIMPVAEGSEMLMIGTASRHPKFPDDVAEDVVTSDMTNIELWNMAKQGYYPLRLVFGSSVYSLGVIGGLKTSIKSYLRGELTDVTRMIYEARENALDVINKEAQSIGADDVVGVNTYIYELGAGLIEMFAIGTAVKKSSLIKTESEQLPPQAVVVDKSTFYMAPNASSKMISRNNAAAPASGNTGLFPIFIIAGIIILLGISKIIGMFH